METHSAIGQEVRRSWPSSIEHHRAGTRVGFHYHEVDERLEVLEGDISFFNLMNQPKKLEPGEVFRIPRGQVHRVEVGREGVRYEMWVPVPVPAENFAKHLYSEEIDLLRQNLEFPRREDDGDAMFFEHILSEQLTFCGVDGVVLDKEGFMNRGFVRRGRKSSGSVQVLNRNQGSLLLATVVTVAGGDGSTQTVTNERLFVEEEAGRKCRVWVNYRDPGQLMHPVSFL